MTTPEPSPLSEQELGALENRVNEHGYAASALVPMYAGEIRRLIAQARAARPSPWLLSRADAEDKLTDAVGGQMFGLTPWVKKCLLDWLFAQNDRPSPPAQDGGPDPFTNIREVFPLRGRCKWHDTVFVEMLPEHPGKFYCVLCADEWKVTKHARPAQDGGRP